MLESCGSRAKDAMYAMFSLGKQHEVIKNDKRSNRPKITYPLRVFALIL